LATDYIQLYKSVDGGRKWDSFAYVANVDADLENPSISVGEGSEDVLVLAYIVDDGITIPYPEVATIPLTGGVFSIHFVSVYSSWDGYGKPVVWTDSFRHHGWYAYLTCEAVVDAATENINVCAWRSTVSGNTWSSQKVVFGNYDTDAWIDPDGAYGTTQNNVYIACYNDTDNTLYTVISIDDGVTYPIEVVIDTLAAEPLHAVDPEIEAAADYNNLMLCCTMSDDGDDDIGRIYSKDAGWTWEDLEPLSVFPESEFAVALTANEGGGSFHIAWTRDHDVMYTYRYQSLNMILFPFPGGITDTQHASHNYPKKGIASNWTTDECGIAWADYRDGSPDYDTYFDAHDITILRVPAQYATIQEAIEWANEGCTVLVEPGRYMENIDFLGKAITLKSSEGAAWTFLNGRESGSTVTFKNGEGNDSVIEGFTILNGNAGAGGGIYCDGAAPDVVYCDVQGGWPGPGNIDANPQLVDPAWLTLDMHILRTSPCRDAGWNGAMGLPEQDFEGDPRQASGTADLGADEFHDRFYYCGDPYPGEEVIGRIVGEPGTAPVGFWLGSGLLKHLWYSPMFGFWYLAPPLIFSGVLAPIPADRVMDLPATVPATPAGPYELYLQAFIGDEFSNPLILRILVK
jgi:hypothetical protein